MENPALRGFLLYNKKVKKVFATIELFLIFLIVILIGFFIFVFNNQKKVAEVKVAEESKLILDTTEVYCGITIIQPEINSEVSLPFSFSGYISGCGWEPYLKYVARLKVLDENGDLVGRPFLVNKNDTNTSPVSTQFRFYLENLPKKEGKISLVFSNFGLLKKEFVLPLTLKSK